MGHSYVTHITFEKHVWHILLLKNMCDTYSFWKTRNILIGHSLHNMSVTYVWVACLHACIYATRIYLCHICVVTSARHCVILLSCTWDMCVCARMGVCACTCVRVCLCVRLHHTRMRHDSYTSTISCTNLMHERHDSCTNDMTHAQMTWLMHEWHDSCTFAWGRRVWEMCMYLSCVENMYICTHAYQHIRDTYTSLMWDTYTSLIGMCAYVHVFMYVHLSCEIHW